MEETISKMRISYSNMRLKDKISIVMISILILLCTLLCLAELILFARLYRKEAIQSSKEWIEVAAEAFNQEWDRIYGNILSTVTSRPFAARMAEMESDDMQYIPLLIDMQPYLAAAKESASTIDDVYMLMGNGYVIRSYDSIPSDSGTKLLDALFLKDTKGITFLPETASPFKHGGMVIPLLIPLERLGSQGYLSIKGTGNPDIIIVYLLDSAKLKDIINNTRSAFFQSSNGLAFRETGLFQEDPIDRAICSRTSTAIPGLSVTMAMSIPSFMPQMLPIIAISMTCLIAIAAIGIVSIRRISRFLTNPLNLMMRMIDEMKAYSYTNPVSPRFHDETGKLIDALNDMYSTIWEQTERIRDEEKQKYRYLSAMLTEQINPHFLYNTLETINMEIRGGKEQDASLMITDLAQFLRTLLNHGEPTITLAEELMNAEAYARIMNRRLNRKVRLNAYLDKDIEGLSVPKSILQPLVENSIKHGFSSLSPENGITDPEITICIERKDRILSISVSDNGSGIDAEKVSQAIQESEETPHVGLKNVYERLKLHFGNADLSVTSYPYFENTIRIEIAMEQ